MKYDIIIIGGGPAGLSAAITARARNKNVLIVSNAKEVNPLAASPLVENYPGMPAPTGLELLQTMHNQAEKMGTEFLEARVVSIVPLQDSFTVTTSSELIEGSSLIVAVGASSGGTPFEGEAEYLGRGVSYCATCDGMLFRSGTVVVVGLNAEAAEEANFMAEIGATVHFVAKEIPEGLDARIQTHAGTLRSIAGDALGVTHVILTEPSHKEADENTGENTGENTDESSATQATREVSLEVNGVFILRPGVAPTAMLPALETEGGFIAVDAQMRTAIKGVFAAGDCTGRPLQVATAVGEGQVAVFSALEYLKTVS